MGRDFLRRGFVSILVIALVAISAGIGAYYITRMAMPEAGVGEKRGASLGDTEPPLENQPVPEPEFSAPAGIVEPAPVKSRESASAGAREEACPSPGPACPTPQIAACKNGKWRCVPPAESGGAAQAGRTAEPSYVGTVLAGTASPLLDFTVVDYRAAVESEKLVLLYFYADWCSICKAEFPQMQAAFNKLTDPNIVGFRVNYKDSGTDADETALARQFGVAYQHTKVFVEGGKLLSKHPDGWDEVRYLKEIGERSQ
jgi:thiol-disulfide isomerase/thioredoxin